MAAASGTKCPSQKWDQLSVKSSMKSHVAVSSQDGVCKKENSLFSFFYTVSQETPTVRRGCNEVYSHVGVYRRVCCDNRLKLNLGFCFLALSVY